MVSLPMAATQATLEPDMTLKTSQAAMVAMPERAPHRADQRQNELDQPPRNAAARHDIAGIDEQRNGEQRENVEIAEHGGMQGVNGIAAEHDPAQCGRQQHHEDRDPHEQKERRQDDNEQDGHGALFVMGVSR